MFFVPAYCIASKVAATITFLGSDEQSGNASTTVTFSSKTLGAAGANRQIIVCTYTTGATPIVQTLTVNGVSATALKQASGGAVTEAEIWIATVPTGTSGDIVLTYVGVNGDIGIAWFDVRNAQSTAAATASSTANPGSASLAVTANGIAVGMAGGSGGGVSTFTWGNLTERSDHITGSVAYSSAADAFASSSTPTITETPAGSYNGGVMALVAISQAQQIHIGNINGN